MYGMYVVTQVKSVSLKPLKGPSEVKYMWRSCFIVFSSSHSTWTEIRLLSDNLSILLSISFLISLVLFVLCWCRWLKFEEDVEDGGERWSKPYVATLSLHSLFELRSCILNGIVMLDMRANSLEEIAGVVNHYNNTSYNGKKKSHRSVILSDCLLLSIPNGQTWFWTSMRYQSLSERRCVGKSAMLFSNSTTTKTRKNWPTASPSSAHSLTSEGSSPSHTRWIRTVISLNSQHTWPTGGENSRSSIKKVFIMPWKRDRVYIQRVWYKNWYILWVNDHISLTKEE